jgi:putative DNA methylase
MTAAARAFAPPALAPFSLRDVPSFIERQFPVGRLSAEAYKERKAGSSQTLTALGSYWKGRKPLILVRAVVLGCLLPATDDAASDLDIFLKLMAMDDAAFGRRYDKSAAEFARTFPAYAELATEERGRRRAWRDDLNETARQERVAEALASLPYADRVRIVRRPEECDEAELLAPVWGDVNRHLDTSVRSLPELVEQLGLARYGHRPKVADTFCGGGSIPFEAARVGCDVFASDLNPIACMLTWGAFNIVGAPRERRAEIEATQRQVAAAVDAEITQLGIEHDAGGNRAKAYLYCLETRCPKTGWMVPMAPSWIISKTRNVVAKLVPNPVARRYDIEIHTGVSSAEMEEAEVGTLRGGRLVHPMNPERSGVEIKTIRGDYRDETGANLNRLRQWEKSDFIPRPDDIFQERLYCIQWIRNSTEGGGTFFSAPTPSDFERERRVESLVRDSLDEWQSLGWVADTKIETGKENEGPIRTMGWTHWHHLFSSRQITLLALFQKNWRTSNSARGNDCLALSRLLDRLARNNRWDPSGEKSQSSFDNQAMTTGFNFSCRGWTYAKGLVDQTYLYSNVLGRAEIQTLNARDVSHSAEVWVTDPPYADAVRYEEITEFFIAWLRKFPPPMFRDWIWDSSRALAIRGDADDFRRDMVAAYGAMTRQMPDYGLQVVMFTHQDAGVWADLGAILWAAGLHVTAAWNVVTETESALKEGNYVQGTVCLVLRKRMGEANARRMEIEAEIEEAVAAQLARLTALDDSWHERSNAESLYTDGDLTLAAYAAALQVVTAYSSIDRQPLDRDLYRKLSKGETTMLRDLISYAESVANNLLVPKGFPTDMWRDLKTPERYYVRMLDVEARGSAKVADFQNFAKSFAFGDYAALMASTAANAASLAGAADLKGRMLEGEGFASTQLRQVLFAIWKTMEGDTRDPKRGVTILKTEYAAEYWARRLKLIALASYVAAKTKPTRAQESTAAEELAEALKLDRV